MPCKRVARNERRTKPSLVCGRALIKEGLVFVHVRIQSLS